MSKDFIIIHIKDNVIEWGIISKFLHSKKDGKYLLELSGADKRSNPQNRYYFGLVVPMIQQGIKHHGTELTKEECHEFLKARFNLSDLVNIHTGEVINIPVSTTRLNKEQFADYIGKIQQFAAEFLNIVIPDPGKQTILSYEDH